jgi:hypothetical protein
MSTHEFLECAMKASPKLSIDEVRRRSINWATQNEVMGETCFHQGNTTITFL